MAKKFFLCFKLNMKVQNITISPQFKGFKNIISHSLQSENGDSFSYMGMELDNEGFQDLEKWEYLQKELLHKDKQSDYIVFTQINKNGKNLLTIDNFVLAPESTQMGSKEETMQLKAISFLASLTQRINAADFTDENQNLHKVLAKVIKYLSIMLNSFEIGSNLSLLGAKKKVKSYKTAELINSQITKRMINYFK